jgi:hypothetical protein
MPRLAPVISTVLPAIVVLIVSSVVLIGGEWWICSIGESVTYSSPCSFWLGSPCPVLIKPRKLVCR